MNLFLTLLGGLVLLIDSKKKKKTKKENDKEEIDMKRIKEQNIIDVLKSKIAENMNNGLYMKSLKKLKNATFFVSPNGRGVMVKQLGDYVLEWEHFEKIVTKANELGGKMYRGDELVQVGSNKLGEEISYDCMEGFIASELLYIEEGMSITRRSTYYSGILAWAGIVTIHKSEGKGSFITVNPEYRKI